ncbi:hypothetical protein [Fibrobacter sp.]|nr:hypothetical protein [Fibrobacter sp.]
MQGVANATELDEDSTSSAELLLDDCESPTEDDDSDFSELDEASF